MKLLNKIRKKFLESRFMLKMQSQYALNNKDMLINMIKLSCKNSKVPSYYYARYFIELIRDEDMDKILVKRIARVSSELNIQLPINDLFRLDSTLYIITPRPGLWIGKDGEVMAHLRSDIINPMTPIYNIELIEDNRKINLAYEEIRY